MFTAISSSGIACCQSIERSRQQARSDIVEGISERTNSRLHVILSPQCAHRPRAILATGLIRSILWESVRIREQSNAFGGSDRVAGAIGNARKFCHRVLMESAFPAI